MPWLTRACQVTLPTGQELKDYHTGMFIPTYKKGDRRGWINYRGISLFNLPGKVGYMPSASNYWSCAGAYQGAAFVLDVAIETKFSINFENMSKMSTFVYRPQNTYDRVHREKLWWVLRKYDVDSRLLLVVKPLHSCLDVFARVSKMKSYAKPSLWVLGFGRGVYCHHSSSVHMKSIDSRNRLDEGVTVGSYRINSLLFADDLVLLAFSEQSLQHALNRFSAACDQAVTKISTTKTEASYPSRNPSQCVIQTSSSAWQQVKMFKHFGWSSWVTEGKRRRLMHWLVKQTYNSIA